MFAMFAKLVVILLLSWPLVIMLLATGPPRRSSRWYPDPDRWDYGVLMVVFATLVPVSVPNENNSGTWFSCIFSKSIALLILLAIACLVWCV